jgi:PPOX class probable F420-dependent enzyme
MTTKSLPPGPQLILKEPAYGQIAMLMPDGSPHLTQLWVDTDGQRILVNTVATHQKVKNARRDPHVAVNVHDPAQQRRIANSRGRVVEVPTAGTDQHIDALAKKYLGADKYPFARPDQQPIILKIAPRRFTPSAWTEFRCLVG